MGDALTQKTSSAFRKILIYPPSCKGGKNLSCLCVLRTEVTKFRRTVQSWLHIFDGVNVRTYFWVQGVGECSLVYFTFTFMWWSLLVNTGLNKVVYIKV